MASLTPAKTLGGIGGILVFIPGVSLVGWILILVALNEISDVVRDRSIFDDALIAGITAIIGAVGFLIFLLSGSFSTLISFGAFTFGAGGVLAAVATLAFFWVFSIVSAIYLKRAYEKTAQRLNVHHFATGRHALLDWCSNDDHSGRVRNSLHSPRFPDRCLLLHPGPATSALWFPATASIKLHPANGAAGHTSGTNDTRVQVLPQLWDQDSRRCPVLSKLWHKTVLVSWSSLLFPTVQSSRAHSRIRKVMSCLLQRNMVVRLSILGGRRL